MSYLSPTRSNLTYCTLSGINTEIATRILDGTDSAIFSTLENSAGKYYAEFLVVTDVLYSIFGVSTPAHINTSRVGFNSSSWGLMDNSRLYHNSTYTSPVPPSNFTSGDVVQIAVDIVAGKVWFGVNGVWVAGGDPAAGTGESFLDIDISSAASIALSYTMRYVNDQVSLRILASEFTYAIPAGFSAWASSPALTFSTSFISQQYSLSFDIISSAAQVYSLIDTITKSVNQPYSITFYLANTLSQIYGIRLLSSLIQHYDDAHQIITQILQYYGESVDVRHTVYQLYNDALQLASYIDQPYALPAALKKILDQQYSISATELKALAAQLYSIKSVDMVNALVDQPFSIVDGTGRLLSYLISVTVNGSPVKFSGLNIESSRDQFCLSCDIQLASQADYAVCSVLDDLTVIIDGEVFEFFIEARQRNRGHGTGEYTLSGLSKSALLDAPYAEPISGELSGLSSQIVTGLALDYTINWQTVDWYIPANTLLAADDTPLEIIRKIAAAAGAVIQTEPGGTITIEPRYPVALPDLQTATPAYTMTDAMDFFTISEDFDHRSGYNRFLISDQLTSDETIRLVEEQVTATKKYIRAYQTPWQGDFDLRHTGGSWVTIEPLGIDEQLIEDEIVEFVAGTGSTSLPIYERVSMEWLQASLGTVTFGEDGTLLADIDGESLLKISYRTKSRKYLVTDAKSEPLQLVATK